MIRLVGLKTRLSNGAWGPERDPIDIRPGELLMVIGPSGTGKTGLCLMLCGQQDDRLATGAVTLDGEEIGAMSDLERAKRLAYVPTDPTLLFSGTKSTVRGELELAWQLVGQIPGSNSDAVERTIETFGLLPLLGRDPFSLSGGEAARTAIAIAAAKLPEVIVVDQAYDNLDVHAVQEIRIALCGFLPAHSIIIETFARHPHWLGEANMRTIHGYASLVESNEWKLLTKSKAAVAQQRDMTSPHGSSFLAESISDQSQQATEYKRAVLDIKDMRFSYGDSQFKLGPIDLKLLAGDRIALIGPNGVGKTTLLKCLAQLLEPTCTSMEVIHSDGQRSTPRKANLHQWAKSALYVFQNPDDQIYMPTVRREIQETAARVGRPNPALMVEIASALGLEPFLAQSPFDLPRPFRRLVCIASALLAQPPVLLLDEPSAGLDDRQTFLLANALCAFRPSETALMFVSHDSDFIDAVATQKLNIPVTNQVGNPQVAAIYPMHS